MPIEETISSEQKVFDILRKDGESLHEPCTASLIELRNSLKREIQDEWLASSRYGEAAAKMSHFGLHTWETILGMMSRDEHTHALFLSAIIETITKKCGE